MHRFLNPHYVLFSLKIKFAHYKLNKKHNGIAPYHLYKDKVKVNKDCFNNHPIDHYHALTYHDWASCKRFYGDLDFTTTHIIRALVYWNEKNRNDDQFIGLVDKVLCSADAVDDQLYFYLREDYPRYKLTNPYYSGITQGKAASMFTRAYKISNDEQYLQQAESTLNTLFKGVQDGGVLRYLEHNQRWVEEYPSPDSPSMVLNGHLFTIIGLADYLSLKSNPNFQELYTDILNSTLTYLDYYFQDGVLLYCMYSWTPCSVHYLGLMGPLFEHVFAVSGEQKFKDCADRLDKMYSKRLFDQFIKK